MIARSIFYRILLVGPLLYVGAIAVRARARIDPYVFGSCTQKQQAAIAAYQGPYLDALPFLSTPKERVDRRELRAVAMGWIERSNEGTLQPLTPVHLDDFIRDGVKQGISRTCGRMAQLLTEVAADETEKGDAGSAISDLVLAVRLAEVLKYSDPYAITQAGVLQRKALAAISDIVPKTDQAGKLWTLNALKDIRSRQRSLEPMVRLTVRLYQESKGSSDDSASLKPVADLLKKPGEGELSLSVLATLPRASDPGTRAPAMASLLRMAGCAQESWLKHLDSEIAKLGSASLVVKNPEGLGVANLSS